MSDTIDITNNISMNLRSATFLSLVGMLTDFYPKDEKVGTWYHFRQDIINEWWVIYDDR